MKCDICESETKMGKAEKYQYTLSGLSNLFLKNIEVERCEKCDLEVPLIPKIIRLHETIARAIVSKPTFLLGEESRFLRKILRMKAQDWAGILRKDVSHISRAEKDGQKLNKDLDLLIRLAFVRLWEEKKGELFPESLPVLQDGEQGIFIDVEDIENFSYFDLAEVWQEEFSFSPTYEEVYESGQTAVWSNIDVAPNASEIKYAKYSDFTLAG